jgi:hypothetical protein
MFLSFWYVLIVLLIVITCINGYFVARVSHNHPGLYESLGRPTPFFFATGGWLTSGRFTRFLLSRQPSETLASDPLLRNTARALAILYVLLLFSVLAALGAVFLGT